MSWFMLVISFHSIK